MYREKLSLLFALTILLLFSASCTKTEEVIIEDNTAPPDYTIPNIIKENYITRSYIALLSRKPTETEFNAAFDVLDAGNLSQESREEMLGEILSQDEFYDNQFIQWKALMLNGRDTADIKADIYLFNFLLLDPLYESVWPLLEYEIDRMEALLALPEELKAGTVPFKEMHRRMLNNAIYDEINMGATNHIISSFQFLMLRYPTEAEIENGVLMLNDFSAVLFLEIGTGLEEYHDIFLSSDEYYEAQARDLFLRFIFREPTSPEMQQFAEIYKSSEDYKELLTQVLSLNEYVGVD